MRRFLAPTSLVSILTAAMLVLAGAGQTATGPRMVVVDDDRAQCAKAQFTSIRAAVDAARPRALIRVCPGRYEESVTLEKPLRLKGKVAAVAAVECFDPAPAQLGDADPTRHAIVDPPGSGFSIGFRLAANDIRLAGFLVEGASVGIDASDRFSGYRIRHNLLRLNTLFAIDFGSEGTHRSRVDHNCIRENRWGLVSELDDDSLWAFPVVGDERGEWNARDLRNARIDHNATSRNTAGLEAAGPGRRDRVTFDHNLSRADTLAIAIQNSEQSRIVDNELSPTLRGIDIGGANVVLEVARNRVDTGRQGIVFVPATFFIDRFTAPTVEALVAGNVVSGQVLDGIVAAADRLHRSFVINNVTSENLRDGIILRLANSGNVVRGNVAERNREYGIYAQGAVGNVFEANWMFGNGVFDARDDAHTSNTWIGNQCVTDFPAGTICGVG